jgi:3-oxoacyl-(acyl-carrier-protein) synthase
MSTVAIVGAAAVSPLGLGWRGLGDAGNPNAATLLASTHPSVHGFEVPAIAESRDAGDAKSRRLMSRSARFAAIAAHDALREAGWIERGDVGYWLGVGASGGPLGEIVAMLKVSVDHGAVSLARLGAEGLLASNPLHTFQVLNNFAMCHGAILEGTGGPNGAFFSRGGGTVHALAEAVHAIESGDCDRALAGGADTALHPVTWAELVRDGFGGLVPSEGAAVLALARDGDAPLALVEHVSVGDDTQAVEGADLIVIAPWGEPARSRLRELARDAAEIIDVTRWRGEALAATPALAWLAALDRIVAKRARRAAILSIGPDGELGVVVLRGAG